MANVSLHTDGDGDAVGHRRADARTLEEHVDKWAARRILAGVRVRRCVLPFLTGAPKAVECRFCSKIIYAGEGIACSVKKCSLMFHLNCVAKHTPNFTTESFRCPQHGCIICKQKMFFWRCKRCTVAAHTKCAPWPVVHLKDNQASAICWRHAPDWLLQNEDADLTNNIEEVFCRLPLPYANVDFDINSTIVDFAGDVCRPPLYTSIRDNLYLIKKRRTGGVSVDTRPHKIVKIVEDLAEVGVSPPCPRGAAAAAAEVDAPAGGAPAGGASPPPRTYSRSSSHHGSPPVRRFFSTIFGMCKDIRTTQQKERAARRKDTQTLKKIAANLGHQPPRSPPSDDAPSEPETFEQQQTRYDALYVEYLQQQEQLAQQREAQQQAQQQQSQEKQFTLPLQARVPSHAQPRPSAGEQFGSALWSDFFGTGHGYSTSEYDFGGYCAYEGLGAPRQSGSRPPGAPCSDNERYSKQDDNNNDDDDE